METNSLPKNEWRFVAAALLPKNHFATAHTQRSALKLQRKRFPNPKNNFVIPSEVENGAVRETATKTGRPKAERTGSEVSQISHMKIRVALVIAFSLLAATLRAEKISLVGATVRISTVCARTKRKSRGSNRISTTSSRATFEAA